MVDVVVNWGCEWVNADGNQIPHHACSHRYLLEHLLQRRAENPSLDLMQQQKQPNAPGRPS